MVKKIEAAVDRFYVKADALYHKYHVIFDVIFYVCFVVFVVIATVCDCEKTFKAKIILKAPVKQFVLLMDQKLLPILAGLSLLFDFKNKKVRYAAFFSLFILLLYQALFEKSTIGVIPHCNVYPFGVACLVIAAKARDFRKVGWTYVAACASFMVLLTILALTGIAPDLVFEEVGRAGRHALGMHYPLNYAAHWFSIALVYCYLKNGFLKLWDYAGLGVLLCVSLFVCKAQTSTVLYAVLIAGTLYRQLHYRTGKGSVLGTDRFSNVIRLGLQYSFIILAVFMIAASLLYTPPVSTVLEQITPLKTFFSRLECARIGLMNYFPSAMGIEYPTRTWNGTVRAENYFFIDCSYVSVLLRCGVVVYSIVMTVLWYIPHRMAKEKQYYGLWVVALFAVICTMEYHMVDVAFNPFLLMVFTRIGKEQPIG